MDNLDKSSKPLFFFCVGHDLYLSFSRHMVTTYFTLRITTHFAVRFSARPAQQLRFSNRFFTKCTLPMVGSEKIYLSFLLVKLLCGHETIRVDDCTVAMAVQNNKRPVMNSLSRIVSDNIKSSI